MGWLYSVKLPAADGSTREVSIPNLRSLNGRKIWAAMKTALSQSVPGCAGSDVKTKEFIKRIDDWINSGRPSSMLDAGEQLQIEQALANIAAQIEDNRNLTSVAELRG